MLDVVILLDSMDNRERFRLLHERFGLDIVFTDERTVASYARDIGFSKRDIHFLEAICYSENNHIRKRVLQMDASPEMVSRKIHDELGYESSFVVPIIKDIRYALNGVEIDNDHVIDRITGSVEDFPFEGGTYTGDVIDSIPNGNGSIVWVNGDRCEGVFVDGKLTGKGKYVWANGDCYKGDFLDGKRTGKG